MLRGPLHNRGAAGLCEACGQPFPCPTGLAIFQAVKREIEHPTPPLARRFICDKCGHQLTPAEVQEWPKVEIGDGRMGIGCLNCPTGTFGIAWSQPSARNLRDDLYHSPDPPSTQQPAPVRWEDLDCGTVFVSDG